MFANLTSRCLSSPVIVADNIDWKRDYSGMTAAHLLAMTNEEMAAVDPLAMNLLVAKEIPQLQTLDIQHYQATVNAWTDDFRSRCLPYWEQFFHQTPQDFRNDIRYFRLGMICQYLDLEVGISYKQSHRGLKSVLYTDPSDIFLNGVIDTKEGTCGTMAALHVAIGWRLGWPVSLACLGSHYICRFDDGTTTFNIESTDTGRGGWSSRTDEQYIEEYNTPASALRIGSDLRALKPREMLGCFIASRARHIQDCGKSGRHDHLMLQSEADWLLSRYLFPTHQAHYKSQMGISAMRGERCFAPGEIGHPITFAEWLLELYAKHPLTAAEVSETVFSADVLNEVFATLRS